MNKATIAVVLAAGSGTRFWPMTKPKEQTFFFGMSLLEHNLRALLHTGISQVCIVGNPHDKDFVAALTIKGLSITFVIQPESTGMAEALLAAKPHIEGHPILVVNADDVVEPSLYTTLKGEIAKGHPFIVGRKVQEYFDGGYIVEKNHRVVEIVEKPGEGNAPSDLVNLVFHFFPDASEFLASIPGISKEHDTVYEQALTKYFSGHETNVVIYDGVWSPLKYPWHILDIMHMLLPSVPAHKSEHVLMKNNVVIEGNVWFGENVKIFENAKIIGPCYIGSNSIIGNNSLIRESYLGEGCITGFNTDITRSYIGENCWFHSNYVGDSVLEGNISMGGGAKIANLRLDEGSISSVVKEKKIDTKRVKLGAMIGRDVRIGINVSIMPGIKIGKNSFVGSGVILDKDLPEDSFCTATVSSYEVKKNTRTVDAQNRDQFKKAI